MKKEKEAGIKIDREDGFQYENSGMETFEDNGVKGVLQAWNV